MKTYLVTIRAVVTKTLHVMADSEQEAVETAHSEFTTECDGDEDYQEDTLRVETEETERTNQMKTSELTGAALRWAVAKCEGIELNNGCYNRLLVNGHMSAGQKMLTPYNPSTDWSQGGPIIERERIELHGDGDEGWIAHDYLRPKQYGPTPLIAAMRCFVASKLGDTVDIPDEFLS